MNNNHNRESTNPFGSEPRSRFWKWLFRLTAVATLVATGYGIWTTKNLNKNLLITFESMGTLIRQTGINDGELQVSIGDHTLSDPFALSIIVKNTGTAAIRSEDIEKPLEFAFANSRVASAAIQNLDPPDLSVPIEIDGSNVRVNCGLLNPGDNFRFTIIADGELEIPKTIARIAGIRKIQVSEPGKSSTLGSYPFLIPLTKPLEWIILLSIIISWVAILVVLIKHTAAGFNPKKEKIDKAAHRYVVPGKLLSKHIAAVWGEDVAADLAPFLDPPLIDWLQNPQELSDSILKFRPQIAVPDGFNTVPDAINHVVDSVLRDYKQSMLELASTDPILSSDSSLKSKINNINFDPNNQDEFMSFAAALFGHISETLTNLKQGRAELPELFGYLFAICLFLVPLTGVGLLTLRAILIVLK